MATKAAAQKPTAPTARQITWHTNDVVRTLRRSALISLAMGSALFVVCLSALISGNVSLTIALMLFLVFYFTDSAIGRFSLLAAAPREVGFWEGGAVIRFAKREESIDWTNAVDVAYTANQRTLGVMTITFPRDEPRVVRALSAKLGNECKLNWLEWQARKKVARVVAAPAEPTLPTIEPSTAPQYWSLQPQEPPAPGLPQIVAADAPSGQPVQRPDWSFTRSTGAEPLADPRYPAKPMTLPAFVWHFIPSTGTPTGGIVLLAIVVLATIAVSRIVADVLLSFLGFASDPWVATGVGLAIGVAMASLVWRFARGELSGEVAGSVMFLPAFDRTKADISETLRDAASSLGAGDARVKEARGGRLIVEWPAARTRAVVLQSGVDSRAILLRTVGRSHFELHSRLKGAILERLRKGAVIRARVDRP